ncbi:MAG: sporulation protein YunB [Anaerovorax sp.]|nr:sporulation protein YunB [Anaerovorax sp.]
MNDHRRKKQNRQGGTRGFLCLILIFLLLIYCTFFFLRVIKPAITSVSEMRVKAIVTQTINEAIREKFIEDINAGQLLEIKFDKDGKITLVQADTVAMNRLSADMTVRIQKKLMDLRNTKIQLPIGSLMGSQILSQMGPKFNLSILPMATTEVNFKTEFESTGINQTRHRVYLEVNSNAKVLVPFSSNKMKLKNTVLVAETIIVGDVPQSYIFVPEKSILDVVN